ncbi:MAG: LdpA C-terminal domain-containing domain [Cyanobacteria bacterium P01_D01_bin.156]
MSFPQSSLDALRLGQWFKLICGASYQDVAKVRNLALVYSLAGADCIDLSADLAIVRAAHQGITAARAMISGVLPLVMVSFNDGQDPHFRKAWFDMGDCPVSCSRPCEIVCPAEAIPPVECVDTQPSGLGVVAEHCYGCGRCLPICPHDAIKEKSFQISVGKVLPMLLPEVDAIEIHTQIGRQEEFYSLWRQLTAYIPGLKLVAVSCPEAQKTDSVASYFADLYELMEPKPQQLIWQTDGRSMSGDIGRGTTHTTIHLAQKVLNAGLPGYVQLAGGTNDYTVTKLRSLNLLKHRHSPHHTYNSPHIHGVAYGSYARKLVDVGNEPLENQPEKLWQKVSIASALVSQIKPGVQQSTGIATFLHEYGCDAGGTPMELPP